MTRIDAIVVALAASAVLVPASAAVSEDALDRAISPANQHRYEDSREVLDPLLTEVPGSPHGRLLDAMLHAQEGSTDEAVTILEQLALDYPRMFEVHNNLALLYVEQGRLEDAREVLAGVLKRTPVALGYYNLATIYDRLAQRAFARSRKLALGATVHGEAGGGDVGSRSLLEEVTLKSSTMAGEVSPAPQPGERAAGSGESPSDATSVQGGACASAGGFSDPHAVALAEQWLVSQGAQDIRLVRERRETISSYRVYLPPLESRESAARKVRELRGKGIRDVAVIMSGSLRNGVSLGVYENRSNADRRLGALGTLGYSALLAANTGAVEHVTIEARVRGEFDRLRAAWKSRFPEHTIRSVACRQVSR